MFVKKKTPVLFLKQTFFIIYPVIPVLFIRAKCLSLETAHAQDKGLSNVIWLLNTVWVPNLQTVLTWLTLSTSWSDRV